MFVALALDPLGLGLLAGFVFRWLNNQVVFWANALEAALLLSLLAWISKTPMRIEKTVMNGLVALDFGLLLPILTGL